MTQPTSRHEHNPTRWDDITAELPGQPIAQDPEEVKEVARVQAQYVEPQEEKSKKGCRCTIL